MSDIKLMLPGEYAQFSAAIRNALRRSAAGTVTDAELTAVMASIQAGERQIWLVYDTPDTSTHRLTGLLVTRLLGPDTRRVLYAEALADVNGTINPSAWANGVRLLQDYAHRNKCRAIEADSNNERLGRLLGSIGFAPVSIRYRLEVPD